MARIAVGGFMHETNSFVLPLSDYDIFYAPGSKPPLSRGQDVLDRLKGSSFAASTFIELMHEKHEMAPLAWCAAPSGGTVTREAYERIAGEIVGLLSIAMPVEAVFLELHGAMVSEDYEDGEGELLRRVRAVVGDRVPVVISLDYHANITPQMVEYSDGMAAYLTYPHVDKRGTGARAAKIMSTLLERGRPRARVYKQLPFLIPLTSQCTLVDPSKSIVGLSQSLEGGDVLNVSYLAGFPPSDLHDCGPTVSVHAYTQEAAEAAAGKVYDEIMRCEGKFSEELLDVDEAVEKAMHISVGSSRPVILADVQDNPGAGGTADTTGLLESLVRLGAQGVALGPFWDPTAAAAAHKAGEGAQIAIELGGKFGPDGVNPYSSMFKVIKLGDGKFRTTGPNVGGRDLNLGPMALLEVGGPGAVRIIVVSKRMQAHDQAIFRHLGVEPKEQKILALKSTVHFRADFGPLAEKIFVVISPGGHLIDSRQYAYRRLRHGVKMSPLGPPFAGTGANASSSAEGTHSSRRKAS